MRVLEEFVYWLSSFGTGADVDSICALNAPVGSNVKNQDDEDYVMQQVNGDLVSVIFIGGVRKLIGERDHERMTENFSQALSKLLKAGTGNQHSFELGFRSDPAQAETVIERILQPQYKTAQVLGIKDTRMLDERKKKLASICVDESVYLVVRTHSRALQPHEKKMQQEERTKLNKEMKKEAKGAPLSGVRGGSQVIAWPQGALMPRHHAAINSLKDDLSRDLNAGGAQLIVRVLSNHEAIYYIRRHLDADPVTPGWRPRLFGDKSTSLGSRGNAASGDASSMLPMRLSRQLVTAPLEDEFGVRELSQYKGTFYASVVLEVAPENGSEPFTELASRLGRAIPWRCSFEILPNGKNYRQMERMLSAVLGAVGDYNKSIRQAFNNLQELANSGVYIGALRLVLTTWAGDRDRAVRNLAVLSSAVEGWGSAACTNETGEPSRAMLASASGFSAVSPAPFIPLPLTDMVKMLPFARPASVWERGQILFTSPEGRPYPVEFGSDKQNYWSTIGFAPTGSGKSFTLNVLNSGLLLPPGAKEVPPITLVDVGHSGALVMNWYKSLLPDHMKDQVLAVTLQNNENFIVNPFDTQHGFDEPLTTDVEFLVAVLGTLSPSCGLEAAKFFERIIRVAYEKFSRISPDSKRWQNAYDAKVAEKLRALNFKVEETTRVWEVVDALFDAGEIDLSVSAQRFAMPTLGDMPKIAADSRVTNIYGEAKFNGESIINIFSRNVIAAMDTYKLISGYTRFNIGAARAVAIDLQEVVGAANSEEGKRRAGLMFLLARRIGARNYFLKWDEIEKLCPKRYAAYQQTRTSKLWETIKFLQYDESHYFSGIESVVSLVQSDLRVGRKYNLVTAMFSQQLQDFTVAMVDNTYIILIMGLGDASPGIVKDTFALSEDEMDAIGTQCVRPGVMFARFKTKVGTLSQILKLNASTYELWTFTTQGKDQTLRAALSKYMSRAEAIALLTDRFPGGSAEGYLRSLQMSNQSSGDDEALADVAAKKLIEEASRAGKYI